MHLSSLFIVLALTLFQSSVIAYDLPSPNTIAHSRDFHTVKRQFRNADYAGAPPPNQEPTSNTVAYSYTPTSTSTYARDHAAASRPTDSAKGNSKDSRSIGSQPRLSYNSDAHADGLASTREKPNAEDSASSARADYDCRSENAEVKWWRTMPKSYPSRDLSDVIAQTLQERPAEQFMTGSFPVYVSSLDYKRELLDPNNLAM